ncbi:flippase [Caldilinea sp.]|uniref:flippase n=1 Tax=Caldilinea sp. TaxID=2293560 RepID=UPI002B831A22|nr:flippase [Caldilinea sp.]HRA67246.1 flippase [Caldilinea sp.]
MSKFSRTVARNSAFGMAAHVTIKVISFTFTVLVIRRLGAEIYGQYAAVLAFGAVFVFFADLGLSPYTVREVARLRDRPDGKEQIERLFGSVLGLRFLLSLGAAIAIITTAWLTGRPTEMIIGVALGTIGLVIYSVQGATESVLAGHERIDIAAGAQVVHQVTFVLLGTLALLSATGYYGLIFANLAGIILMTLVCWQGVRRLGVRPTLPMPSLWLALLRASIPFGVIGFTLGLSYKFDTILLNIYAGDTATGYYNSAYNLIFSVLVISNVVNTALYPSLARQSVTRPETLPAIQQRMLRYLLLIALPITVGGSVLAPYMIGFLYGVDYAAAALPLSILIWVIPFMFVTEFLGYVIVVNGAERRVAWAIALSTTINVGLNVLLIPIYGILAAALLTVFTEAVLLSQYAWVLRDKLRVMDWNLTLLRPALAALLMGGIVYWLRDLYLPLDIMVGAVVYLALLFALGVVGRPEFDLLQNLRRQQAG